jgi:hypothetical protein
MTTKDKLARRKLSLLERATEMDNVSKARPRTKTERRKQNPKQLKLTPPERRLSGVYRLCTRLVRTYNNAEQFMELNY